MKLIKKIQIKERTIMFFEPNLFSINEKIQLPIPAAIFVPIPSIMISVVVIPNTKVA